MSRVAPWHIDPVDPADEARLKEIMDRRQELTGDHQTKAGTIRRAVRALWAKEVNGR